MGMLNAQYLPLIHNRHGVLYEVIDLAAYDIQVA